MGKTDDNEKKKESYTNYPTRLLYLPGVSERIEKLGACRHFPKNYILQEAGEVPAYCYFVKKGRVIAFEFTVGGEERVYNYMEETSIFMEAMILLDQPSPVYFKTTVPSDLICIEKESLLAGMHQDPDLMMDVLRSLSDKFMSSMDQLRQTTTKNATWKLCNLLLIFADRFGEPYDGKILIREKVSQQMLSNMLGINRITTVRIIKSLKNLNLIEQVNGYYCIRNAKKLKEFENESTSI